MKNTANHYATKETLEAFIDDSANASALEDMVYDKLELPKPGDFDFMPYWLEDAKHQAMDAIRTTKQYYHGDIADSTGEDYHTVPGRADRLRARAQAYLDGADQLWCAVSEGYWSKWKVGQVVRYGHYTFMCVGNLAGWDEEMELQADDGSFAYYNHGPMAVYAFVLINEEG